MGTNNTSVLSDCAQIPADGRSYTTVRLTLADYAGQVVSLRLGGLGSFDPHIRQRRINVAVGNDGAAHVLIYAPRRPGRGLLSGPGFKHRIEFKPATWMQGLVFEWIPTLGLSLIIALALRTFAFASHFIPSPSMADTLAIGDLFFAEKFSYRVLHEEPRFGDIVLFKHPTEKGAPWIKRVIGLPGDTIAVHDGVVYRNGAPLSEDYIREKPWRDFPEIAVPADQYFMMGDNRNHSCDSRSWGCLPRENVLGRAVVVFWPPEHMRLIQRAGGTENQNLAPGC
ncbi:signal peptidase I [bacterium]|nr:signal peptidase I [bacterium]